MNDLPHLKEINMISFFHCFWTGIPKETLTEEDKKVESNLRNE